jgi:hypothetical protein
MRSIGSFDIFIQGVHKQKEYVLVSRRSIVKAGKIKRNHVMRASFVRGAETWLGTRDIMNDGTMPVDIIKITHPNGTCSFDILYNTIPILDTTRGSRSLRRAALHKGSQCIFSWWEAMPTMRKTRSYNSGIRVEKRINRAIVGRLNICIRYTFDVKCWDGAFISITRYTMMMGTESVKTELFMLRKFLYEEVQQYMWDSHNACVDGDPLGHDDSYYQLEERRIIGGIVAGLKYVAKSDNILDESLQCYISSMDALGPM